MKSKYSPNKYDESFKRETVRLVTEEGRSAAFDSFKSDHLGLENEKPETAKFVLSKIHDSLGDWDWRDKMSSLLMPVLTIQGQQDPIPMASAKEWVEILPNARLLKIPDSGHLPFVERPDIFYPAVEHFLNGEWPDGS